MLKLDYANCLSDRVGDHGLDPAVLAPDGPLAQRIADVTGTLGASRGTGWQRWRDLARDPMRGEHLSGVAALVDRVGGSFDSMIVLGIGGSALGNLALQGALNTPTWNLLPTDRRCGPRLFVVDNVDPAVLGAVLDVCDPNSTLINVISKSGETAETAAQFIIARDWLEQEVGTSWPERVVAITDPATGTMRQICDEHNIATLPVPEGVGGRFSVLSPVGLFSAAMCGIDIEALLDGAAAMDERSSRAELGRNPAAMLAVLLVELGALGKTNHVLMPYASGLYLLADWYRQLWAESLGKRVDRQGREVFAGFTPIKALGTTDQHSQVQLYREGPNDKVIGMVEVDDFGPADMMIPDGMGTAATAYLQGRTLGALLAAEKRATEFALIESERPNFTIHLPTIDAFHVGEFIMLWQIATAYAGELLDVDAYDQPAVETGKKATFGLMGKAGFEGYRTRVDATLTPTRWVV